MALSALADERRWGPTAPRDSPSSAHDSRIAAGKASRRPRRKGCLRSDGMAARPAFHGHFFRDRRGLWCPLRVDAPSALPPSPADAPYIYGATDIRPRQTREIELCEKASHFDWQYAGAFFLGFLGSIYVNIGYLKQEGEPGVRLIGPGLVGFTWGGFLSGGYLSLPKCDPLWAAGPPPEGNVRAAWPMATVIAALAAVSAPFMDYVWAGTAKLNWPVPERSARVFVAAGTGVLGALFPYLLPPKTWAARKEIDRMRVEGTLGGAQVTYTLRF